MNKKNRFNPDNITDKQYLDEFIRVYKIVKKVPTQDDLKKHSKYSPYCYRKRFGGTIEVQKLLNLNLKPNMGSKNAKYDPKNLLDELLRLSQTLGKTPTQSEINKYGKYPSDAYKRHFGTYNNALEKLGLQFNTKYGQTVDEIKTDIIRVHDILGHTPTIEEFTENSKTVSCITACHKLSDSNSWNKTLKICGLPILYHKNLTHKELKDEILRLQGELGRIPGYSDMMHLGIYAPETYAFNFGTYGKALKFFGFDYVPDNQWYNQTYTRSKDGTLYKSKFEANIANVLYELKLEQKILDYEYERKVVKNRQWTCDFYIRRRTDDIWLEADGMGGNRSNPYSDNNDKISYYKENGFNYVIIAYGKSGLKNIIRKLILG